MGKKAIEMKALMSQLAGSQKKPCSTTHFIEKEIEKDLVLYKPRQPQKSEPEKIFSKMVNFVTKRIHFKKAE